MDDNVGFVDLEPEAFPFVIEFFRVDTGEVVLSIRVAGPGAVHIPPLAKQFGAEIEARVVPEEEAHDYKPDQGGAGQAVPGSDP